MVVVGGITRLTQSGLSMVEWAPIMGTLPPLSESSWLAVFAKYQLSPEYQKINLGMSLDEFKSIFWWEYGHRVLGRFIGLIYLIPLLIFLAKGMIAKNWYVRLFVLFALGGAQGLMGWYMVKSGLVDVPHVSQYRLTAHLGLALIIFAMMFYFALEFLRGSVKRDTSDPLFSFLSACAPVLIFVMMLSGGFVAGTKAGFIMNTFPLMNGEWLPSQWMALSPWWKNLFENPIAIQFVHRCLALLVSIFVLTLFFRALKQNYETGAYWLLATLVLQVLLGISALLLVVPVALGAAHQAGAVALFAASIWVRHLAQKQGS